MFLFDIHGLDLSCFLGSVPFSGTSGHKKFNNFRQMSHCPTVPQV
jgi:hypothetical protein